METNSTRGTPEPSVAATVPATPTPEQRSLTANQEFEKQIKSASPAEFRKILAEATPAMRKNYEANPRGQAKQEAAVTPAPAPTPEPKPEEAAAEPEEQAIEPAAEETPADDTPAEPKEDGDPDEVDDGEGPVSPITGKRTHLRLPQDDKVGRLAAAIMRRNRDMSMTEAIERANSQLGIKPKDAVATEPEPKSNLPDTLEGVDLAIKELRETRRAKGPALEFEAQTEAQEKLEDLMFHRLRLEREGERKEIAAASAYDQHFTTSEARAVELYDFAGKPDSEGGKRMLEIEADLKDNDDPLYSSPDKPLRIAQMVAAELKIAPRKKGAPAAPAKAAAPAVPAPKKMVLPAGGSRTTPPPVNTKPAIISQAQAAKNPAEWREVRKQLGLSH